MTTKEAKGYIGIGMDGFIADWYAKLTLKNIEAFRADAKRIAAQLQRGADVLEVAPGPGYLAIELAKMGLYHVTGLDISARFVEIAQKNAGEAGVGIDFRQGDASRMPFEAGSFDFIVCRAAFKNFSRPVDALNEMHRVLKPGGKALIIDLRGDASEADMDQEVQGMHLSAFNAWLTKGAFKHMLIKRAYKRADFEQLAAQSAFGRSAITEDKIGLEVCLEK